MHCLFMLNKIMMQDCLFLPSFDVLQTQVLNRHDSGLARPSSPQDLRRCLRLSDVVMKLDNQELLRCSPDVCGPRLAVTFGESCSGLDRLCLAF